MANEDQQKNANTPAEDGDAAEGAEGAEAPKKGLLGNKMVLIGGGVFVVLVVVGIGLYFMLGGSDEPNDELELQSTSKVVMFEVPVITTNLIGTGPGPTRFIKAQMVLELGSEQDKTEVEHLLPRLQDDWQNFLRQMRPEDLEGSLAMQRLKEALQLRANQVLAPVLVRNVLFRELLVQ